MSLAFPWMLLLLPLAGLPLWRGNSRPVPVASIEAWRGVPGSWRTRWRRRLPPLQSAATALLILALAGPQVEKLTGEDIRQGVAIQLLVDISSSMDQNIATTAATRTTRMEAAKEVVAEFIRHRPDDLLGLVTFARYADTLSPLTFGHDALVELVRELKIQDQPNEDGTAYGDALSLACARLGQLDEWQAAPSGGGEAPGPAERIGSRVVVLLTDGENNCGLHLPQEAAGFAKQQGIRIHAISIRDNTAGGPEETDAERLLARITSETGGGFWKISDAGGLAGVYAEIDRLEKSRIRSTTWFRRAREPVFAWLLAPALLLAAAIELSSATFLRAAEEEAP